MARLRGSAYHEGIAWGPRRNAVIRPFIPLLAAACTSLFAGGAVGQTANVYEATLPEPDAKTEQVGTGELKRLLADGSATLVDTRARAEFVAGHIPGARSLDGAPSEYVAMVERIVAGDKSKALVLYCNGPFCQASKRLAEQLVATGFTNVRRYQLGLPIWRALGGPTAIELEGILRIFKADQTVVYFDARSPSEFAKGSLPGAHNIAAEDLKSPGLPFDDFNRRIVLFGRDGTDARKLADAFGKRAWHNVSSYPGTFESLLAAISDK
jgi:rhodanese-related sulfurtransferase